MQFLKDMKTDLFDKMSQSKNTKQANEILTYFSIYREGVKTERQQVCETSKKVQKLIRILNSQLKNDKVPKVIIFVKDRVVAEYLKNLL
jgi:ERCC4-related helicase